MSSIQLSVSSLSSGRQVGHQIMMLPNLSNYSMRSMGVRKVSWGIGGGLGGVLQRPS